MKVASWCALAVVLVAARVAAAQTPGVVVTQDGGAVRGTIVENIPGQDVVVSLPSGETQRIEWSRVKYVGPAANAPPETPPGPAEVRAQGEFPFEPPPSTPASAQGPADALESDTGSAAEVPIRVESNRWGLQFQYRRMGEDDFQPLCFAPCTASLRPGRYQLRLWSVTEDPIEVASPVDITRAGTLTGEYTDQSEASWAGVFMGLAALVAGPELALIPLEANVPDTDLIVDWAIGAGILAAVVGVTGLVLALLQNGARATFTPVDGHGSF